MIHTSAPATLMLMGEHAVLHGTHALAASLNQRLHIFLTQRTDKTICLSSELGTHECSLNSLKIVPPFTFALSVIAQFIPQLYYGFNLKIESEFSSTVGLGSSAALLSALSSAMLILTGSFVRAQPKDVFDVAYKSLLEIQGQGSGTDLATSILGGVVFYRAQPFLWQKLNPFPFPVTVVYSGYKTPTVEVIQKLEMMRKALPEKFNSIFNAIDQAVLEAKTALIAQDSPAFIQAFKRNQVLMQEMAVMDQALEDIISLLNNGPEILAAKISGSGLGDCVIGIGNATKVGKYTLLPVKLAQQGLCTHAH